MMKKALCIAAIIILASVFPYTYYPRYRMPDYDNLTKKEDMITRQYAPETVKRLAQKIKLQKEIRYSELKKEFCLECIRKTYQGYYAVLQLTDGRNAFIFMDDQLTVSNVAIYDRFRTKEEFEQLIAEKQDATRADVLSFDPNEYPMPISVVSEEAHIVQEGVIIVRYRREDGHPVDQIRFYTDSEIAASEVIKHNYSITYSIKNRVPCVLEIDRVN